MSDPQTPTQLYTIPNTGSDPGSWGPILNANFLAIDGSKSGFATVSLTNANVTLTKPSGSVIPGAGPTQSQNAQIIFSGMLTGNCVITFPLPGYYIVKNNCTVGAFYVAASTGAGGGKNVGLPPGQSVHIFSNGTDMEFVDLPPVGSYWDYAGSTVPAWITACTLPPWLVCDGSPPLIATYPQLAAILGTTFGGNGLTTFGVPDLRNRSRFMIDTNQGGLSNRVTSAGSGINGQVLGAAGGDQLLQSHTYSATVTDPGHAHNALGGDAGSGAPGFFDISSQNSGINRNTDTAQTNISVGNSTAGGGAGQNMPPALIAGLTFIRAG